MRTVKFRNSKEEPWQQGILHGFIAAGDYKATAIVEMTGELAGMCCTCPVNPETFGFEQPTPEFVREQQMARARQMGQIPGGPGGPVIQG